jgi:hypothetical protein
MRAGAERRRRLQAHCGLSDSAARRSQCGGRAKEKLNGPAERAMMRSRRLSDCRRAESGGRPELTRTGVGCWGTGTASHPSPLVGLAAPRRSARICTAGASPISNAHSGSSFARRKRNATMQAENAMAKAEAKARDLGPLSTLDCHRMQARPGLLSAASQRPCIRLRHALAPYHAE